MSRPLRSMTGFGAAAVERDGIHARVEIRSVNQRGLRLQVRCRPSLGALEKALRDDVCERLRRGQIDVTVEMERLVPDAARLIHRGMAASAVQALRSLQREHGLAGELTVSDLVRLPGLFESGDHEAATEAEFAVIREALARALDQAVAMREAEGAATAEALRVHIDAIESFARAAAAAAPQVVERTRLRLAARLAELAPSAPAADAHILERELVLFADRADIGEELDRLASHVSQFRDALREGGEVGKRLDFLAQELLREVNTTASKANDTGIAREAVQAKLAVEKIKEQAANIE